MTATANEASNLTTGTRPGRVTIARVETPTGLRSVWFYVIVALGGSRVFGVDLGTNASYLSATTDEGMRLVEGDADGYTDRDLSSVSADILEALSSFLGARGLSLPEEGDEDTEARVRRAVQARENELRAEFQAWKDRATETAHEYANENALCGEFDRCMEAIGLPRREREYGVTVDITVRHTVYVNASSSDEAEDIATENLSEYVSPGDIDLRWNLQDVTVYDVTHE